MKFITSTDLKLWAGTKECEQLLPELIRKLIYATVHTDSIDKSRFPSGNVVFLPGWDGILDCKEKIDQVPAGISLWECGATRDVKGKIDDDFNKRDSNPSGYDKSKATFVFVTPRIWEGAESWLQTHGKGWGKLMVYTAVELESWIERTPSVGMWLAELLRKLPSGGIYTPETYWNRWAQGDNYKLSYDIVLHGRESISNELIETCKSSKSIFLQALTQDECIAFAIATLATNQDATELLDRTIIVTDSNAYEDLVAHYDNLVIITPIAEGVHYSSKQGHSIIVATTPEAQISQANKLPIIKKKGFVSSLVGMGMDEAKAEKIATDTARDINVLRRRLEITVTKPRWSDSINELLPAILVGRWIENCDGDKEILESLSGIKYEEYEAGLIKHLAAEATPLFKIANIWRLISSYDAIEYLVNSSVLTSSVLAKFRAICLELIQDEDPKAVDDLNNDEIYFRKHNQKYSNTIKKGVFQNLCLFSVLGESNNEELVQWVDETVRLLLKDWTLNRFLSNRDYLVFLAEASPRSYLTFIERLSDEITEEVFKPRKQTLSLSGWNVYYSELLWSLEMLSWEESYLKRTTSQIIRFSRIKNESNYANRPSGTLNNIYRFYHPQTYVLYNDRIAILKSLSSNNKDVVFLLCLEMCKSLFANVLMPNNHYKWRLFGKLVFSTKCNVPTLSELSEVVDLMLSCCNFTAESVAELVSLSSNKTLAGVRSRILDSIKSNKLKVGDKQKVIDALREVITHHIQCEGADWAMNAEELIPYQNFFEEINHKDILIKNAWLFNDHYIQLPRKQDYNTRRMHEEQEGLRCNAIQEIVKEKGKDALWELVRLVKCPESMATSIVSIWGDSLNDDICYKFKSNEISEIFIREYLTVLCRKDILSYQKWADSLVSKDSEMQIVLYGPGYINELADVAERLGVDVKRNYWEKVQVGFWTKEDTIRVIGELANVGRYAEAIEIISSNRKECDILDEEIVQILYRYIVEGSYEKKRCDMYHITSILGKLDESENPLVIDRLVFIEFALFRHLEHQMDITNLCLKKELSNKPELMIQIVELAYPPDDGNIEELEGSAPENRRLLAECAYHIIHLGHNLISFNSKEGEFEGDRMTYYIKELYRLAEERKRLKVINYVVGEILGDIPRDEKYPPIALCQLVEDLHNDVVDEVIYARIYNSRGVTCRAYNEGGDQERYIVAKFEKFKERTRTRYPRISEIFNRLIKAYKNEATRCDNEAIITDLE